MSDGESKIRCCIGTQSVRSMNQGKLEVIKQGMARMNIDILKISKLKWTGMDKKVSQEAIKAVWYFHLLQKFPQFVVITQSKPLAYSMKQK